MIDYDNDQNERLDTEDLDKVNALVINILLIIIISISSEFEMVIWNEFYNL